MFTTADVSTHTTAVSCYSVIQGSVYDLTMWVNAHPGGKGAILSLCGIDGTEKFMNQHHGGKKFMDILSRFKIGTLTQ
jgi:cytochrome b involved in lipid metabolism